MQAQFMGAGDPHEASNESRASWPPVWHPPQPYVWKIRSTYNPEDPYARLMMPPTVPMAFIESCVGKAAVSCVMGSAMGAGMGLFFGSLNTISPPLSPPGVPDPPSVPIKWQMRETWLSTSRKARRWARNFGAVGTMYSGVECCIERYRGKHDILNPVLGGFTTGAILAVRQGPWAMGFGGVGFACFSYLIEQFMPS